MEFVELIGELELLPFAGGGSLETVEHGVLDLSRNTGAAGGIALLPSEVLLDAVDAAAQEELRAVDALQLRAAAGANHQAVLPCRVVLLRPNRQDHLGGRRHSTATSSASAFNCSSMW